MQTKSKSTKVYASVLGLAAAAFAIDRWVIGHPEAAAAAAPPAGSYLVARAGNETPAAPAAAPAADARAELSVEALSARLQLAAASQGAAPAAAADAFRPARAWVGERPIPQPQAAPAEPARDPAAEFRQRHKLNAVIRRGTGTGGAAVIDGQMLSPGQTLDGFKLVGVGPRSATLESADGGRRVEMVLEAGSI